MGLQGEIMVCGLSKTLLGLVLRFIVGPASVAIGAVALGLRGKVLCVSVIQVFFLIPEILTKFLQLFFLVV